MPQTGKSRRKRPLRIILALCVFVVGGAGLIPVPPRTIGADKPAGVKASAKGKAAAPAKGAARAGEGKARSASFDIEGRFIVSLISDGRGGAWVGTEDCGVYHFDPQARDGGQWRQYAVKDGLGDDNAYALAVDRLGRLWVGHLNHGVSVYNGESWRNYDVPAGPIGERVFDIQCCPADGDVWMATSAGLTRYRLARDAWTHYTRADGLPEDAASSLAFDKTGNLYVGTQCRGVAVAQAVAGEDGALEYKSWRVVSAPDRFGPGGVSPVPLTPTGTGLPTNLVNQVLVGRDGTIWAATTAGLAWSRDGGQTWRYLRGRDYADKARGLYGGPPAGWKEAPPEAMDDLLPEDYVTCLAEDDAGAIWLGTRRKGFLAVDPRTNRRLRGTDKTVGLEDNYVSAILPMPDGRPLVGSYNGGLVRPHAPLRVTGGKGSRAENASADNAPIEATETKTAPSPGLPSPAGPPSLAELNALLEELGRVGPEKDRPAPLAVALPDDWRTQGDWLGRYGRYWAILCAICSPYSYEHGCGAGVAKCVEMLGPNSGERNSVRYWVHWLYSADRRVLELPPRYLKSRIEMGLTTSERGRRQAEVDDNGEAFPATLDGPHLYFTIFVPPGDYVLSLYFFNKDGHEGKNRMRDYLLEVKGGRFTESRYGDTPTRNEEIAFERLPSLACARVRDFWGGVYKRFLVRGGYWYGIRVARNYSHNTICSALMLDLTDEQPPPYYWAKTEWTAWMRKQIDGRARQGLHGWTVEDMAERAKEDAAVRQAALSQLAERPEDFRAGYAPRRSSPQAAAALLDRMRLSRILAPRQYCAQKRRVFLDAARALRDAVGGDSTDLFAMANLASCLYEIHEYPRWEALYRDLGIPTARQMEHEASQTKGE